MDTRLYFYYSTQRPVDIGTTPRPPDHFVNFDKRVAVEEGAVRAWGIVAYREPLTGKEQRDYELRPSRDNPDIRERMEFQAQAVGAWEERNRVPPEKRLTRREPGTNVYAPLAGATMEQLQRRFELAMDLPAVSSGAPGQRLHARKHAGPVR